MVPFLWRRGWSRSFGGAARSVSPVGRNIKNGVVRSTSDNRWLEPTTPSAPAKEASRHFLNGRSHPSLSKEGTSALPSVVFNAPHHTSSVLSFSFRCFPVGNLDMLVQIDYIGSRRS